jgi:GNAT superfamily N-acetyltransferase
MTIRLRPVTEADDSRMREVFAASREPDLAMLPPEVVPVFVSSQYELQLRHYEAEYPGATWCVIERDGADVGRLVVDRTRRPFLVVDIAVLPEARSMGIGTALLRELIDEARRAGTTVSLTVRADNVDALRLYRRLGFASDRGGRTPGDAYIGLSYN